MQTRPLPSIASAVLAALSLCSMSAFAQQDFGSAPAADPRNAPAYPQQGQAPDPYATQQQDPYASQQQQPQRTYEQPQQQYAPQQQYPAPQPGQTPPQGQYGNAPPPNASQGNALQMLIQQERQDFGVAPQAQLQQNMHGPTPTSIPGGQVITTDGVLGLIQQAQQNGVLIFHVLGPGNTIPGALNAAPASQAGTFSDQTQQEFGQFLQQVTQGNKARPMVFYCMSTQCWMSYNAALRAINMGYGNVLWYRGGIEAWQRAQQLAGGMSQQPQNQGSGYR